MKDALGNELQIGDAVGWTPSYQGADVCLMFVSALRNREKNPRVGLKRNLNDTYQSYAGPHRVVKSYSQELTDL